MKNKNSTSGSTPAQPTQPTPISYYIARVPGGYYQLMRIVNGESVEKVGEPNLLAIITNKLAQHATATHVSLL